MPIELVASQPDWPERFAREAERLRAALGDGRLRLEHVGSTSVPGLAAKDVIDIQLSVPGFEPMAAYRLPIERLGYVFRPDDEPRHRFFKLEDAGGRRLVNLHVCEAGGTWERDHLAFRDFLRAHPDAASEYERLKRRLAPEFEDVNEYAEAKGPFIREVVARVLGLAPA